MGNDPPGQFTRVLHPRHGRHGMPPPDVIPIGRSVIVPGERDAPEHHPQPALGLPDQAGARARALRRRAPARADDADAVHRDARDVHRADGRHVPRERRPRLDEVRASPLWGFLADRLDHRIAVSERARESAERWLPGDYEIVPNGVLIPPDAEPGGPREPRRLRRPARGPQGPARPAPGLAGDPRAHGRDAAHLRRRPACRAAADDAAAHRRTTASTSSASCRRRSSRRSCSRRRRSSRPRSAVRASASCSCARWPARRRWSRPTSPGTVTS